ncbi:MAG TPA: DUF2630 family protein [Actinomycetota bacterium]|jgi:hypothetical protein|nr:DUF2630 family protein [Actinomycetota bacterium]
MAEPDRVMATIQQLAHEEHELRAREGRGEITDDESDRLQSIQVELDQCWDFLRQRKARARANMDPSGARVRDAETVEHYKQ